MKRAFKGVWIPAELYLHANLSWCEKLILVEVDSFTRNDLPCYVSNEHLATFTQHSLSTVEKAIARLVAEGYLDRKKRKVDGRFTRFLAVNTRKIGDMATVNIAEEQPYILRPTNNNIPKQVTKPKKEGTPVNLEVVIEAFTASGSNEIEAAKFYDYYSANGWTQGRGAKKIVDWKAAARSWIRRTNEFTQQNTANGFDARKIDGERLANYIANGGR